MKLYLLVCLMITCYFVQGQSVGIGTTTPNSSAALDVSGSGKGFLLPRMSTAQRKAITNPAMGLLVFDTDKTTLMFYDGASWRAMAFADENKSDLLSRTSSQPTQSSGFGTRVAISGDYAIISAPRYNSGANTNQGVAYIFNRSAGGWKETARLTAYDSLASDYYGGSIAISGDYAVVGAPSKKIGANVAQGKVYVYHRNGSAWTLDTAFTKFNGTTSEDFGWSVAVCAYNTGGAGLAIGIPYSDAAGTDKGEVWFYKKTTTSWQFVQNVIPTDLAVSDYYGSFISMDTDYVAVGAPYQDNATYSYSNAGAVYIYAFGGGTWNFQQKLQGTTAQAQFGAAISINPSQIAVGAPWAITYSNTSASVFIYKRTGSTWTNTAYLFLYNFDIIPSANQIQATGGATSISIANTTFGISVSLSGNILLIGSSGGLDYPNGGSSYYSDRIGAVYVYKNLSGNTFTRTNIRGSDYPSTGDLYGQSVGISGNQVIIGSPHAIVNGLSNAGNIYFGVETNQ
jgi:hypothetical protein